MKKWLLGLCILLTVGWMALIFGFSSQSGKESGGLSGVIAQPLTQLVVLLKGPVSPEEWAELYWQIDGAVRTAAHFAEYAVLGGLLMAAALLIQWGGVWLPWAVGIIYACTDEWHQAYIPGRVCDPLDIVIDACGVLFGILVIKAIAHWRKKHVHHP